MSQDVEPSIIDYARFYGLACDHRQLCPLQGLKLLEDLGSFLDYPPELVHIDVSDVKVPDERLTVDAGVASLLSSITESAKHLPSLSHQDLGIERHRVRRMKHELPLLRSDHALDIVRFATRIEPDLENKVLPFEMVDVEEDEGFEWPSIYHGLPDELTKKSRSEKLEASKDDFLVLQHTIKPQIECVEHGAFEVDDFQYKKVTGLFSRTNKSDIKTQQKRVPEPASPPLLPVSPSPEPYVPSSDTGRLHLLSDATSPTREEARDVERLIFADDSILPLTKQDDLASQNSDPILLETESLGDIYSPLKGIKDPPSSPPSLRQRPRDLKVEVPLSPRHSDRLPPWKRKSVSFSEALPELIPELPPPIAKPGKTSSDDVEAFFEETIKPVAVKAERVIEQEQLQGADTILRVPVPVMDFSLPIAPWKAKSRAPNPHNEEEALKKTLTDMKALHFNKHGWPISGQAERELKWAPFPVVLGKTETQETIPDNGFVEKFIVPPEPLDVDTLTWKPDGLHIFDILAKSEEEELEEGDFPEEKDINSLIRKRKLELEADDIVTSPSEGDLSSEGKRPQGKQKADVTVIEAERVTSKSVRKTASKYKTQEDIFNNSFSAMGALEDYMNLRRGQMTRRKITSDHHFAEMSQSIPLFEPIDPHPPKSAFQVDLQVPSPPTVDLPCPALSIASPPCWYLISDSFLNNRRLSRQVQRLYPAAEYIERDFTLHHHHDPQKKPRSKANTTTMTFATMADEADMLLSPSTGLIWTSLQKIKQRSLPGQTNRSAVRDRISRTSQRYERLLVLVNQNRNTDPSSNDISNDVQCLDDDDSSAFAEFTAFCSALPDEVQTFFIAGSEEDLAKWIVAVMVKYGMNTDQEVKLLQDETQWEIFLRRAGMNAFAAQAILGTLKAPGQEEADAAGIQATDFGLTAFVKMSVEERFARFETLFGGRRLLWKVSKVLDAKW